MSQSLPLPTVRVATSNYDTIDHTSAGGTVKKILSMYSYLNKHERPLQVIKYCHIRHGHPTPE